MKKSRLWYVVMALAVLVTAVVSPYPRMEVAQANAFSWGGTNYVSETHASGDFQLFYNNAAAKIYVASNDHAPVVRAVNDLKTDIGTVTGVTPTVQNSTSNLGSHAIIIGTIGKSTVIDNLISQNKLDVTNISGKWESFVIQVVDNPVSGVSKGLVIAGSDKRGTIYGIYDVSDKLGVTAWTWWASITPRVKSTIVVKPGTYKQGEPAVKYRGIFVNSPPFQRWTYGEGKWGPDKIRKYSEFLLRMRGNYFWTAENNSSDPNDVFWGTQGGVFKPDLLQEYGIVKASAHAYALNRSNI